MLRKRVEGGRSSVIVVLQYNAYGNGHLCRRQRQRYEEYIDIIDSL